MFLSCIVCAFFGIAAASERCTCRKTEVTTGSGRFWRSQCRMWSIKLNFGALVLCVKHPWARQKMKRSLWGCPMQLSWNGALQYNLPPAQRMATPTS
eukprot:3508276-Amphidinium_carterae.1